MKRVFLALVAVFASVVTFAGNPLKITNSTVALKQFMKERAKASLVIDWSKAQYDNKKSASAELGNDYNFIKEDCVNKLIEGFNAKSKGIKLTKDEKDTEYKFTITVSNLDSFLNVMGFGPRWEAKMWGILKITDAKGGTVAEVDITEAEDGTDYVRREAFGKTFMLLGYKISKLK